LKACLDEIDEEAEFEDTDQGLDKLMTAGNEQ